MTLNQQIIDYVSTNPGATVRAIAVAVNRADPKDRAAISAALSRLHSAKKLLRSSAGKTVSNVTFYSYYPAAPRANDSTPRAIVRTTRKKTDAKPAAISFDAILGTLADSIIDQIATGIAEAVAGKLKAKIGEKLSAALPKALALPEPEPEDTERKEIFTLGDIHPAIDPPAKVRLPRVTIVGLLPAQAGQINTEFCDAFHLLFPNRERYAEVKAASQGSVKTYVMKFNGHNAWDAAQHGEAVFVAGGLTDLKNRLRALYHDLKKSA